MYVIHMYVYICKYLRTYTETLATQWGTCNLGQPSQLADILSPGMLSSHNRHDWWAEQHSSPLRSLHFSGRTCTGLNCLWSIQQTDKQTDWQTDRLTDGEIWCHHACYRCFVLLWLGWDSSAVAAHLVFFTAAIFCLK